MKNEKKSDLKKVGKFLKGLDVMEYRYLELCMQMTDGIQSLIKRHKLSKAELCERFKIQPSQYVDFTKGNYNYKLEDMARLNAFFVELETKLLEKETPIQIAGSSATK